MPDILRHRSGRRFHGDSGVTTVMVGLLLVVMLVFAGLAVDGGQAYAERRLMQNAADAASMAGTRMLDKVRFGTATNSQIIAAAHGQMAEYEVDGYECFLVANDPAVTRLSGNVCGSTASLNGVDLRTATFATPSGPMRAAGLEVVTRGSNETFFGGVAGLEQLSAGGRAAATVQPYLANSGSPFIVCGKYVPGNPDFMYDLWDEANGTLKPGALGMRIALQAAQIPTCGAGSAFKGKGPDTGVAVGSWVPGAQGNGFDAQIRDQVAGQTPCPPGGPFNGCWMLLPIATDAQGNGNNIQMFIAGWAVFQVYGDGAGGAECKDWDFGPISGSVKYCGVLRAAQPTTGGSSGTGDVIGNLTPRTIKLVR